MNINCQTEYWDNAAKVKTFTNTIPWEEWTLRVDKSAKILDVGCGYGRTCIELIDAGYTKVTGIDISPAMIQRGKMLDSRLDLEVQTGKNLPYESHSFNAVTLLAVLTCVPGNDGQKQIISEIQRVLKPGGFLYVSDYLIQPDKRNQDRYAQFASKYGQYGVFELPEGAVVRHHTEEWFDELFADFDLTFRNSVNWKTMNGHSAAIEQRIYQARN